MKHISKKSIIFTALFLLAGAAVVFAHGGGYGMGPGPGYGRGHMMEPGWMGEDGYGHMRGWGYDQLSKEDAEKLQAARDQFFKETRQLRDQMIDKNEAIRSEMSKQEPDNAKLTKLQQELSQLESQFDQKALQHRLEVRKIVPDSAMGTGYGRGHGRGYGRCW